MRDWYRKSGTSPAQATVSRRQLILGCLTLLCMAALMIVGLTPRSASAPNADSAAELAGAQRNETLNADCELIQTLRYQPCGHQLTRRQALPSELAGKGLSELEAAYDLWQITSFASDQVEMEQTLTLYCPEHLVLMPDDSGMLCVFRNKYGDALALVSEINLPLNELPDTVQEELRPGKGFSTQEELDLWLEANDS